MALPRAARSDPARSRAPIPVAVVLAAAYLVAALLGRAVKIEGTQFALVWPAAAVGYLWLQWSAQRGRFGIDLLVLCVVSGGVTWSTGAGVQLSIALAIANATQAAVAVLVVRRLTGGWYLRTPGHVGALALAAVAGSVSAGLLGGVAASLFGIDVPLTLLMWVVRNTSSTFVLGAVALRIADAGWRSLAPQRSVVEGLATLTATLAAYVLVFGDAQALPIASFLVPGSVWIALRYPTTVAAAHVLLVGTLALLFTASGTGPFAGQDVLLRTVIAQGFALSLGLVAMTLALHRDERDRLLAELADARDTLAAEHASATEQAALLETVLDTVDVAVVACDARGRLTLFNRAAREFHGGQDADPTEDPEGWATRFRLLDQGGHRLLRPDEVPLRVALESGSVHERVIVIAPDDSPARTVRVAGRQLRAADGTLLGAVVAQTDITRLEASVQEFRQAFLASPTPSASTAADGTVGQANAALRRLLSLSSRQLVGRRLSELVQPEDRDLLEALLAAPVAAPVEVRLARADGSLVWCEVAATRLRAHALTVAADAPLASPDGTAPEYVLVQLLDIEARRSRETALERAAQEDPLTGLGNRTVANLRLNELQGRPATERTVVAYMDLDGFKQVNDLYGHDAGDAVLLAVAGRLRTLVRAGDEVVRLGGDEFLLLCPLTAGAGAAHLGSRGGDVSTMVAQELAARVEALLSEPIEHQGLLLRVGVSVGTIVAPGGSVPAEVLTAADQAMYERKRGRRAVPGADRNFGPDAEQRRLRTLRGLDVLDTAPDSLLDETVQLAALIADVPTSLVSLVDAHRQWFKARCGLDAGETGRDVSFCAHVVNQDAELHVHDATVDPRFLDNPLVTGELGIRSYAGFPLRTPDGYVLGSLCVIGYRPGSLDDRQRQVLRILAGQVAARLTSGEAALTKGVPAPRQVAVPEPSLTALSDG